MFYGVSDAPTGGWYVLFIVAEGDKRRGGSSFFEEVKFQEEVLTSCHVVSTAAVRD